MFSKILVPLDGSKNSEQALKYLTSLAANSSLEIRLLRVLPIQVAIGGAFPAGTYAASNDLLDAELLAAKAYLKKIEEEMEGQGYQIVTQVTAADPATEILDTAAKEKSDLILLTSHGRTGFKRMLLGSVAERVVRHAQCPVLIVGKEALAQSEQPASRTTSMADSPLSDELLEANLKLLALD